MAICNNLVKKLAEELKKSRDFSKKSYGLQVGPEFREMAEALFRHPGPCVMLLVNLMKGIAEFDPAPLKTPARTRTELADKMRENLDAFMPQLEMLYWGIQLGRRFEREEQEANKKLEEGVVPAAEEEDEEEREELPQTFALGQGHSEEEARRAVFENLPEDFERDYRRAGEGPFDHLCDKPAVKQARPEKCPICDKKIEPDHVLERAHGPHVLCTDPKMENHKVIYDGDVVKGYVGDDQREHLI